MPEKFILRREYAMPRKIRPDVKRRFGPAAAVATFVLFAVFVVGVASFASQTARQPQLPDSQQSAAIQRFMTSTPPEPELTMHDLYKRQGEVIAQGNNATPAGAFQLTTYRVEALALPQPMNVVLNDQSLEVSRAWRLTIQGGPFNVGALGYVIWIDDTPFGFAQESQDLTELSAVLFDPAVLRDGATLAVSYGENKEQRIQLPERLNLMKAP
jgi:hypothetical protein